MINVHISTNNVHIFKAYDFERQSPQTYEESPLILVSLCSCSNPQFISENSGSPYLLGAEKTLSLRLKPRCALTSFLCPAGLKIPFGSANRGLQEFYSARKIPKCQSRSQKFLSSDFCGLPQKSRRNFWRDCHFCKPHTLGVIFSWHYGALAGNVDVLAFAKL